MRASILLKLLDNKYKYYYSGYPEEEIYSVQTIINHNGEKVSRPNILYVTDDKAGIVTIHGSGLLYIPEEDVKTIANLLQDYINRDYRRRRFLGELGVLCSHKNDIKEVCDMAAEIMGNPVCFLSTNFYVVSASYDISSSERFTIQKITENFKEDYYDDLVVLEPNELFPYDRIMMPIKENADIKGYFYCQMSSNSYIIEDEREYIKDIVCMISQRDFTYTISEHQTDEAEFIEDLIDGRIIDNEIIKQKMRHFGIKENSAYYCLTIKTDKSERRETVRDIERKFGFVSCCYEENSLFLVSDEYFQDQNQLELINYLKTHSLYAGVSYPFSDFSRLSSAYMQSILAIELRGLLTNKVYLAFYGEVTGMHIYKLLDEAGINLLNFCDPIAIQIDRYDNEHDTKYLESLAAYICMEGGMQKIANALSLHVNTLSNHIKILEERFQVNFRNHREVSNLRRTMEIFSYLGKINIQKIFGNEQ